ICLSLRFNLFYLFCFTGVFCQTELTQPGSMTLKPGQPLTLSCKVSGYSVTSTYCTAWIQQTAGKSLEWIGVICYDDSTAYKDSLKHKFSITRDTSSNPLFLKDRVCRLKTAVYYCDLYKIGIPFVFLSDCAIIAATWAVPREDHDIQTHFLTHLHTKLRNEKVKAFTPICCDTKLSSSSFDLEMSLQLDWIPPVANSIVWT
uniref:Ig-like domain-containing protein n=1 Tax=Hucho hucho TaxID=62062 RepID=A0A4W5MQ38_9TELE